MTTEGRPNLRRGDSDSGRAEVGVMTKLLTTDEVEKYRAVKMQEAVVKMQEEQQEAEKMGMVQ